MPFQHVPDVASDCGERQHHPLGHHGRNINVGVKLPLWLMMLWLMMLWLMMLWLMMHAIER
jgi:hypothetical protein